MARLLCFILLLISITLIAQDSIVRAKDDDLSAFLQKWGKGVEDPRKEPLHLNAGALEVEQIEKDLYRIIATEGVRMWQGDENEPIFSLVCDRCILWIKPAETQNKTNRDNFGNKTKWALALTQALEQAYFYAEDNVYLYWADSFFKGRRIYFNLIANRGVVVKGSLRSAAEYRKKQIPLHVRAEELLIYSQKQFTANNASISTCRFADPHYYFAASKIQVTRQDNDEIFVEASDNVFYGMGIPLFYFPHVGAELAQDWPIKSLKLGRSSRFGAYVYSTWGGEIYKATKEEEQADVHLKRMRWFLDLDLRQKRGLAVGPQIDYRAVFPQNSQVNGKIGGYYFRDQPLVDFGTGQKSDTDVDTDRNRHRLFGQHRHLFPNNWRLDAELSLISDRTLLTDYFEKVAREDKEQETYGYLKWRGEDHAFTVLSRVNLNDFQTQVAYLPQIAYQVIYQPLLPETLPDLYWSSRIEFSQVLRQDDEDNPTIFDDEHIFRSDWNNLLYYKFSLGPVQFLPFAGGRISYFEKERDGTRHSDRESAEMGMEVSTNFYRLLWWKNDFLDVNRILHILTPAFRYRWVYANNIDPDRLIPYDELETVDRGQQLTFRLTNRLKTVRNGQAVDYLFLEAELSYFPNRDLAGDGITTTGLGLPVSNRWEKYDNLKLDLRWWLYQKVSLSARAEYNFQIRDIETWRTGITIGPWQDFHLQIDARYQLLSDAPALERRDNELIATASLNYIPNPKWGFRSRIQYDFQDDFHNNEFRDFEITIRRNFHRFAFDIKFNRDFVDNDTSVTVDFYPLDLIDKGQRKD